MEQATEVEYLRWLFDNIDIGPAQDDVMDVLREEFVKSTGKNLPDGY